MISVALFGATGLIGPIFSKLLKEAHPDWSLTIYARKSKRSEWELKQITHADHVHFGDFNDGDNVAQFSSQYDIIINAGDSHDPTLVTAIIVGLQRRIESGLSAKLIHISGAGNFIDSTFSGNFEPSSKVWNDEKEEDIQLVNEDMLNGKADLAVLEAGKNTSMETYIICPSVVYGGRSISSITVGLGYNILLDNIKRLGFVPYVDQGSAIVSTVHILDLTRFLIQVTEMAHAGPPKDKNAYHRYYFVQTSRQNWKELSTLMAKILHQNGVIADPEPKSVTVDQAGSQGANYLIASNMLMEANRAAQLGFQPSQSSILEQMQQDLKDYK